MNNPLMAALIIESVTIVVMLVVLFWLVRSQMKLKQDHQTLHDMVHGNSNDIAGLCSAALAVDSRIVATDEKINDAAATIVDLATKIAEAEHNEQSAHPYSIDIRKVRSGASVNELMQGSGLSHDEAALLIRLHGSKTQP